jgi:hypothetical protein
VAWNYEEKKSHTERRIDKWSQAVVKNTAVEPVLKYSNQP